MTWRDLSPHQKTHLIKSIWREGISAAEIASAIGVTKGVVIGHYGRYREDLLNTPLRSHGARSDTKRTKTPELPQIAAYEPLLVKLEDNNGCSWPVNDGAPYLFCGHSRLGKYSYCAMHRELSRGRGTDSERSAHRVSDRHASS